MKYLLMAPTLLLIIAILLVAGERLSTVKGDKLYYEKPSTSKEVFDRVNVWRKSNLLPQYEISNELCIFAHERLQEIKTDFSHKGYKDKSGKYSFDTAENLAKGYTHADEMLRGWLESPTHKNNLLKPYKYSCVATDNGFTVQLFSHLPTKAPINNGTSTKQVIAPTSDPDPIVNCRSEKGSELIRKSQCTYIDCEINGQWHRSSSEDECRKLQIEAHKNDTTAVQPTAYKDEVMDCPIGKQVYRYTYDECINKQNEYFKTLN